MSDRHEWERDAVVWLAGRAIEAAMGGTTDGTAAARRLIPGSPARWRALPSGAPRRGERRTPPASRSACAAPWRRRGEASGGSTRRPSWCGRTAPGPLAAMFAAARNRGAAPLAELGVAAGTGRELFDEPCDAWVTLPDGLPAARYVALRVVGDSMTPLLHSGDVVLVDLDAAVPPGAIAVARHPDHGSVVKRVAPGGRRRAAAGLAQPRLPAARAPARRGGPARAGRAPLVRPLGTGDRPAKPRLAPRP